MKLIRLLSLLAVASLAAPAHAQNPGPTITEANKGFLGQYEAVRAALAADDLPAAKKAAAAIAQSTGQPAATLEAAKALASADSIKTARDAFKTMSKQAVQVAQGQPGYFHAHCPMVPGKEGDWVQTNREISNPYFGKSMAKCGSIQE